MFDSQILVLILLLSLAKMNFAFSFRQYRAVTSRAGVRFAHMQNGGGRSSAAVSKLTDNGSKGTNKEKLELYPPKGTR